MATTTSDYLVQRLFDWGVRKVYGYPGDGINGVMGALNREKERVEFVQARHEEEAAFMACAHAKFTGEVGICIATSGPGAIHLLNGLYDAKLDHQPVVAIVGQQATTALGADYQQEVDLLSLFKDVAHHYVHMATSPSQVRHLVDRAVRIALAERTVTCIILPSDIQEMDAVASPDRKHGTTFTGLGFTRPDVVPRRDDLQRAAAILNAGQKVAILVGAGALGASEEVTVVAELLSAGVAKALLGKAVLPDYLPFVTGCIGLLGTKPSWEMMNDCDTFLMIGSGFPYSEFLPKEGQARGVQIDISPRMLGLRYPMEVNLQGDCLLTLRALIPLLQKKTDRQWRDTVEKNVREWWEILEARAMIPANPINPQRLFWELSSRLPDNCIITCDSGSAVNWYARDLKMRPGMMASLSGGLATMCPGLPYAITAKMNHPERMVIALVGDGAMQMQGINNLITVAKHWKSWSNPRMVILVLNNRDLNQVTWEQRVMNGDPKFSGSEDVPEFPYARYAEMLGLAGVELSRPEMIVTAWGMALTADKPVVIDAHCDPDVPPLPPHITFEQAKGFLSSLFKGDPNRSGIVTQSAKQMMSTLLSRSEK
ncbi:MAG: thiamine pyrophosphate-requiring protein [Geobacteraceae bacterium GWC2_58_44]|nr:MAG: thiamine pyrophosphate-requiring protein [Geobacteraceae bacterium GWC2_58_44]HBG07294.1 thiamine pyrophosphate-requiring protein [Geobacter sp.]